MKKLYYTVNNELSDDGFANGIKSIYVYEILDNTPQLVTELETDYENNSRKAILEYFEDSTLSEENLTLIHL